MKIQTICLNMIVKNESEVIRRSLASVLPIIDCWVIVDTGSSDGTQEIIRDFMKDKPGALYERAWVHFEHNRNEALELARNRADYILFIDADEEFIFEKDFIMPIFDCDFYLIRHQLQDNDFWRISIIKDDPRWSWNGVIHETITHPAIDDLQAGQLLKVINIYHEYGGGRSKDPNKCMKDAAILEKALLDDPTNSRYAFYLAQSYFEAGNYLLAYLAYQNRIAMNAGNEQERFWSYYRVAIIEQFHLKKEPAVFLHSYAKAYQHRPSRIEPLYHIAYHYFEMGKHWINYLLLKMALATAPSSDFILVERWMRDWGISYQLLQSAYALKRYQEAANIARKLLTESYLPNDRREALQRAMPLILQRS